MRYFVAGPDVTAKRLLRAKSPNEVLYAKKHQADFLHCCVTSCATIKVPFNHMESAFRVHLKIHRIYNDGWS